MPGSGERDTARVHILVASEDGSARATQVVQQLTSKVLQRVVPHPSQRLTWLPIEAAHHPVVNAMQWKSRSAEDMPRVRDLHRRLAAHLAQGPDCFVFFHFDADVRWSRRPSPNLEIFDERVRAGVRQMLLQPRRPHPVLGEEVERSLERLVPLVPYFEMEAWTLQNTSVAIRLAKEQYGGRDVGRFEAYVANRDSVDDDESVANTVLGKKHNLELAGAGYPTDDVLEAGTSLAAVCAALRGSRALVSALRSLA